MADSKQGRSQAEARTWIPEYLRSQPGKQAEGWVIRGAAESEGFHEKTLRRAAATLEQDGILFRSLHGSGHDRNVTWSLKPVGEDCGVCGHPKAVHGLRGLACRKCPSLACTKRKEKTDA